MMKFFSLFLWASLWVVSCHAQISNSSVKTHYRTFGKGEPILILNGGPGMNSEGFATMAEEISKMGYQTIIYDQRGTGKSVLDSLTPETIRMDLMVEDMENLRKELNIEKWTILGHSFGGLLACHYYAKYAQNVKKLVFSSSGGVNLKFIKYLGTRLMSNLSQTQQDSLTYYQKKLSEGDTSLYVRRKRAENLANAYVFQKKWTNLITERLLQINFTVNRLVIQDLNKIKFDYTRQFVQTDTPVLVIQGENDIISPETAEEIKKSFGNATLILLKNCAHYGWLDQPTEYYQAIKFFLKS